MWLVQSRTSTWIDWTGSSSGLWLPEYHQGVRRRRHRAYQVVVDQITKAKGHGDRAAVRLLTQRRRRILSQDPNDLGYRRLRYVRYADLCRARHKSAYAEARVMPTWPEDALVRDRLPASPSA